MHTDPGSDRTAGLATRCAACGTAFRVVQDQLKVSEGWVRCGQCSAVFNALEGLFDLDVVSATPAHSDLSPPDEADLAEQDTVRASLDPLSAPTTRDPSVPSDSEPGAPSDTRVDSSAIVGSESSLDAATVDQPHLAAEARAAGSGADATPEIEPEFARQSHSIGGLRWALSLTLLLLLAVLLLGQSARQYRDEIAARWPESLPALDAGCKLLACSVQAPRRIDSIVVESSTLTRHAPVNDSFRLALVLRNRAVVAASVPSIDLTLTDASGQVIARRMLSPNDFRIRSAPMPAGAEASWQALLSIAQARVTGYTVEAFYP